MRMAVSFGFGSMSKEVSTSPLSTLDDLESPHHPPPPPTPTSVLPSFLFHLLFRAFVDNLKSYSTLIGRPETILWTKDIHRARVIVEREYHCSHVTVFLAELDLCLIRKGHVIHQGFGDVSKPSTLTEWKQKWLSPEGPNGRLGKRLLFHCRFAEFCLASCSNIHPSLANQETLEAAQKFLRFIASMSPMAKERMKYMCEFGYVIVVFVSCFVLRAIKSSRSLNDNSGPVSILLQDLIRHVRDIASFLKSVSTLKSCAIRAYGCALEGACDHMSNTAPGPPEGPEPPSRFRQANQSTNPEVRGLAATDWENTIDAPISIDDDAGRHFEIPLPNPVDQAHIFGDPAWLHDFGGDDFVPWLGESLEAFL